MFWRGKARAYAQGQGLGRCNISTRGNSTGRFSFPRRELLFRVLISLQPQKSFSGTAWTGFKSVTVTLVVLLEGKWLVRCPVVGDTFHAVAKVDEMNE